jgi:hypothetical protein
MEKRNLSIDLDTATRWCNSTNKELKALALETFPELGIKPLPKCWKDLVEIDGFYIDTYSLIDSVGDCSTSDIEHKNIFATQEQAEAALALAQLSQLKKVYNGDWVADWNNTNQAKYTICFTKNDIFKDKAWIISTFLSFKSSEIRDLFFENFQDLIEQARPLMS